MDFLRLFQAHKWGNAGWLILFALSVVLLIYLIRQKRLKSWLLFLPVFSLIIIFNPLFAKLTVDRVFPSYLEYERLTWVMCIPIIIAAVLADSFGKLKTKQCRRAVFSLAIILVLISQVANPLMKLGSLSDNVYKVSDKVLEVADALIDDVEAEGYDVDLENSSRSDAVNRPKVLVQSDSDAGKDGDVMYYGIRQYTSKVQLGQTVISPDTYNADGFNIADWALEKYQYFICVNNDNLRAQAESLGFELLVETDDYLLFKNMKELTLYFVRHGQTEANISNTFAGCGTDTMLTEEGKTQALATGDALSDIDFTSVYTSELTRTRDTANLILSRNTEVESGLEKQVLYYLDDICLGEIDGMSAAEVLSRYPDYSEDAYLGGLDDYDFVSPVGAENKHTVVNRIEYAIYNQIIAYSTSGEDVLVVGHSSFQWWLQNTFIYEDIDGLDNASITVLKYYRGAWQIQCVNASAEEYEVLDE